MRGQVNPGVLGGLLVDFGDKTSEFPLDYLAPLAARQLSLRTWTQHTTRCLTDEAASRGLLC